MPKAITPYAEGHAGQLLAAIRMGIGCIGIPA